MLANPKRCPSCEGSGHSWVGRTFTLMALCHTCHGSGVVCGKCGKPEGECGCEATIKADSGAMQ